MAAPPTTRHCSQVVLTSTSNVIRAGDGSGAYDATISLGGASSKVYFLMGDITAEPTERYTPPSSWATRCA